MNNKLLREELNYDINKLKYDIEFLVKNLNDGQLYIYHEILKTINLQHNNLFFIHGHGDTGKIYLWNIIISKIRSDNKIVLAVTSSRIASLLLPKGRTAHSRFRIPLLVDKSSTCHIKKNNSTSKFNIENLIDSMG